MVDPMKPKPTDFTRSRAKSLDLPTMAITKKSKGSSPATKHEMAYNVDSVDKLIRAFEERERSLKAGR